MRRLAATGALLALVTILSGPSLHSNAVQPRPRIVAVGDVHGAATAFAAILERAGLIDGERRWIGGNSILVQTGDLTDRGAGMREALDLLMALEPQAQKARGRILMNLGNHEVMNMLGQMRDANEEIFVTFGGEAAMRQAFGPRGRYGQWLRRKPVVTVVDRTIFMHGGIDPDHTTGSLEDVNRQARQEIEAWDAGVRLLVRRKLVPEAPPFREAIDAARAEIERINALHAEGKTPPDGAETARLLLPVANIVPSSLFHQNGPLWFRGFSQWTDEEGAPKIAALLARYQADRFVTGHTVQAGGQIRERFARSLWLIDTGMLGGKYFPGGRPSALEITPETIRPIYLQ